MTRYSSFTDASGGRGDSFANAIAHAEGDLVFLDSVYEKRAPFDPSIAVREVAELLRSYGIAETTGDRYAANWVTEGFAKEGIRYLPAERDRSSIYLDVLPLFTAGRVRLLDIPRSTHQFASLQRRVSAIGRDRVGHPPGGSDDVANAISGALVMAAANAGPVLWHKRDLLVGEQPVEWGALRVNQIFATAAVDERGIVIAYWGAGAENWGGPRTLLIDFQHARLTADLFPAVAARLQTLNDRIRAIYRHPTNPDHLHFRTMWGIIYTTSPLKPHAEAAGFLAEDGGWLLRPREALLLTAAAQISLGEVKITDIAAETALTLPLPLGEIRSEAPRSAAGDAALLGIAVTLPHEMKLTDWVAA